MKESGFDSFEAFWPHYVGAHRKPLCRGLHYLGSTLALGCTATGVVTANPLWLLAAPLVGYGLSWVGHFALERNVPATFGNPLYSVRGDFRMLRLALTGRMADEVTRLYGSADPDPDAPLLAST